MQFRRYEPDRDKEAVRRTWLECGWIEDDDDGTAGLDLFLASGRRFVAEVNGDAECLVGIDTGTIRYQQGDLPFGLVSAVTTSRVARKQGIAQQLTASAVAAMAEAGEIVSGLGMFEQGFYDRLGFGTGSYEHILSFDPSKLRLPRGARARPPRRLTLADHPAMHANRISRRIHHGSCNFPDAVDITHAEMRLTKGGFGLGYFDDGGDRLSHHIWFGVNDAEDGPYRVRWLIGRNREEQLELLALLRSLGDQLCQVRFMEPPGMQLQDLLERPWRNYLLTRGAELGQEMRFLAWWQMRMNDVPACVAATRSRRRPALRFNLVLTDPIEALLPADRPWRGVAGDYVVTFGEPSAAEPGRDNGLPTLHATVNAFTRMWLGVRPAGNLALTDDLEGPPELLDDLDDALSELPAPHPDWPF